MKNKIKAISLFSGGLDSVLAAKVMQNLGITVFAYNFDTGFHTRPGDKEEHIGDSARFSHKATVENAARAIDIPLKIIDITDEFLGIVTNPEFGYGRNLNPCIDCRIIMLRKAGELMQEIGAYFIITGEVLGQRPMSQQRSTLNLIEKRSGLQGLIVRPLSAKLLKPTLPESKGLIDREKLFDFSGRTRKPQIKLAQELGIKNYAQPAGGCFLTDENYARRIKDLLQFKQNKEITIDEIQLALCGRQFRISKATKAIVGRDEEDNRFLSQFFAGKWVLKAEEFEGPLTLVEDNAIENEIEIAAQLTARYCDGKAQAKVRILAQKGTEKKEYNVSPIDQKQLENMRI